MSWSFRKVELSDSETVLKWRNNPEIYKYLFTASPVDLESHEQWMKKICNLQTVLFLMAELNGDPSGTVRFDFTPDLLQAEIGIYLAPELHGKGLSVSMLTNSEQAVKREFKSLKKIIAKVLLNNKASIKMFEKAGYKKTLAEEHYIQLEKALES